uniref:Uncharacterized protein n=1 Tax=Xiphophorus maculatus TaxID=8083 RepID=A0A3B5QU43_XIPMA
MEKIHPLITELMAQDKRTTRKTPIEPEINNLSQRQDNAIKEIQNLHSIIITPADKGSTIVSMDKVDYAWEAMRQLEDENYYKSLDGPICPTHMKIEETHQPEAIALPYWHKSTQTQILLPKIHKEPLEWTKPFQIPKGRPIISDCNSEPPLKQTP